MMCQTLTVMMYNKTRHRKFENVCSWLLWWLNSAAFIFLSFLLIIHSVHPQIIHDDNIAQESSNSEVRVQVRMLDEEPDDQYSYLSGKDLMADEAVNTDR